MNSQNRQKTRKLTACAELIALATVLSLVRVFKMPLGGSVTLLSMLPVCLISVMYGVRWGTASAFIYSLIQLALDIGDEMSWGLDGKMWAGMILFDYIIAFTALGLSGLFRKKGRLYMTLGVVLAVLLRFLSHVISGAIVLAAWVPAEWNNPFLYSICYNGAYMLPELTCTVAAVVIIIRIPYISGVIAKNQNI